MRLQGIWRKRQNEKNAPCLKDRRFQGCFNGREEWKVFGFIVILRAIATALVANIHFKGVYPNDILSFGGGYGLALFYMISGYLLANINANSSLKEWYLPKLLRLYVPLYIVRIIELLVGYKEISTIEIFLREFIFPGSWFGGSMVFLYLLYFVIVKYWLKGRADYKLGVTITAATICYIAFFVAKPSIATFSIQSLAVEKQFSIETPYLITHFIWIVCMFTGYWLRKTEIKLNKNYPMVILLITSILVFLAVRLITRDGKHVNLEFALGPAYVGFALALFMLLMKKRVFVPRHFKNNHGQTVGCHKHVFAGDILHSVHVDRMAEGLPFSNQFSFADYFDYGIGLCGTSVIAKNFKKISFVH